MIHKKGGLHPLAERAYNVQAPLQSPKMENIAPNFFFATGQIPTRRRMDMMQAVRIHRNCNKRCSKKTELLWCTGLRPSRSHSNPATIHPHHTPKASEPNFVDVNHESASDRLDRTKHKPSTPATGPRARKSSLSKRIATSQHVAPLDPTA